VIKRILILLAALGALAAGVFFAPNFAITSGSLVKPNSLSVAAAELKLVCPGAAILSGGSAGTSVGSFARIGQAAVLGSASGSTTSIQALNGAGSVASGTPAFGAASSAVIGLTSQQQGSTALNAGQLQNVANPRLNGLMGASCQAPSTDLWLVGGDTSTGRETLLLLTNPSNADATVSVTAVGLGGATASSSGVSVAAGGSQIVPLSSILPETKSIAVHVISHGSAVAAWLQQRTLRGLNYAGADFVSPSADFATTLQVPGIMIRGSKDGNALAGANSDYFDLIPTLRIYNPNSASVNFVAQIFGADSKTFGTVIRDTVPGNSVSDFPITGLQDGDYAAFIKADSAVTASVRLPRTNKAHNPVTDFAWLPASQSLTGANAITVPATGTSKLSISNSSSSAVSVKVGGSSISIAAQSNVTVAVAAGKQIVIDSGTASIGATLIVDLSGAVAALPVVNYENLGNRVDVLVR
jgi:hypothetical protein